MRDKEGVQTNGAGIPEGKASETGAGLTSPPTGPTEHTIDLKATYRDPRDPDKLQTGQELLQKLSRGDMVDRVQRTAHKQIAELTVRAEQGDKAIALATDLQKQMDRIQQQKLIRTEVEALNLSPQSKPRDDELWPLDDEKDSEKPRIDSDYVLRGIEQLDQKRHKDYAETAESAFKKLRAQEREQEVVDQEREKRIEDFVSRARNSDIESYKADFPTAPLAEIQKVVDLKTTATELSALARRAVKENDHDTAEDAYTRSRAYEREALMELSKIKREDETMQRQIEQKEQIELISRGGARDKEQTRKRQINPKKADEDRKARLVKAQEIERLGERYRNV